MQVQYIIKKRVKHSFANCHGSPKGEVNADRYEIYIYKCLGRKKILKYFFNLTKTLRFAMPIKHPN